MMTDWAIPQQAKLKYTQLFNLHDRSRSGFLSGLQCRDILMQSGLPRAILAEIWNLSDIDGDGQLTREEFILAMHLTNQARAGQSLPQELPLDLVPPSYRRTRSISTTSVQSASSSIGSNEPLPSTAASVTATSSTTNDDQLSQKSTETAVSGSNTAAGSILNSNSFEDKRRENFEKGRAELERRRQKIIEQQMSILNEQLVKVKKQVGEAKAKIDSMRSERDTKAGLITSLEAQLATVRERKVFLDHEEAQILAIARDLNLVNSPNSAELDQQATNAKQVSIDQMKEKLLDLEKERDSAVEQLAEVQTKLDESKKELKTISSDAAKTYETYKEKIANAKVLRQQFIDELKSKPIDLQSVWDSTPSQAATSQVSAFNTEPPSSFPAPNDDPWSATDAFSGTAKQPIEDPFAFTGTRTQEGDLGSNNNNDSNFETTRDYGSFSSISPKQKEPPVGKAGNTFNESDATELTHRKKMYRVLYEFEARNPDELTINPGVVVTGSEVVCEPGWLSGEINGRNGLFPEAYVELLPFEETPISGNIEQKFDTSTMGHQDALSASQEPVQQASPTTTTIVKYKVIYAFEARNPDELTINPGDIVTGVDLPHEPGWLMGELNAQRGLFPEAYVERLAEAQVDSLAEHTTGKSRAKKAEVATVIANYRALGQEQLSLEKGQLVLIRRKMDSGWWEGELQIKVANEREDGGNELDFLMGELVDSELDYVSDLRLCQTAYIEPLSVSFDVKRIFTNWSQLMVAHESALKRIHEESGLDNDQAPGRPVAYPLILETFQELLNSIVELYVDFCSFQNDATRRLQAKMASDIRFRQLVNESQRKLRKLIEDDNTPLLEASGHSTDQQCFERAQRNSNLPLASFLLKPMQRITKYGLLFDRMLSVVEKESSNMTTGSNSILQTQLKSLKESARMLCNQVNEACRLKEDDKDNARRLRWCQSHILQQQASQHVVLDGHPYATRSESLMSTSSLETRLGHEIVRASSMIDSSMVPSNYAPLEYIHFDSNTNCLGPRRLIKAGCLLKMRSGRELVVFLFNDFIFLTQTKGGSSMRNEDIFRSERAQQAYYKPYRQPILLEDIQTNDFDSNQLEMQQQHSSMSVCNSLSSPIQSAGKEQASSLMVCFLDRKAQIVYNLMAPSPKEKADWARLLSQHVQAAYDARNSYQIQNLVKASRRLRIHDCFGRLFVTVLELVRIGTPKARGDSASVAQQLHTHNSWSDKRHLSAIQDSSSRRLDSVQNLIVKLQLRLYKRTQMILDDEEKREIVPLSDEFRTKPVVICQANRQPAMVEMNETMSNLEIQRDVHKLDNDCTQFLLVPPSADNAGVEYLDIELVDESQFREPRQMGRKRVSLDQLLGRSQQSPLKQSNGGSPASNRKASIKSGRGVQPLMPNRPMEMILKLKTIAGKQPLPLTVYARQTAQVDVANGVEMYKYNVKLRLHLQTFCDIDNLI